ncbi:class I SAM-dependent methyltransferase [Parapedomonas caeni]
MSNFQDHFSRHAALYRDYRPRYPAALFTAIAEAAPAREAAWDCGCGNGQASLGLAAAFDRVFATDASAQQVGSAERHPKVHYSVSTAEASTLDSNTVDAVLVAQALHWFDVPRFYDEVARVCRPGGLFVAVMYELATIDEAIDTAVLEFYRGDIGPYWPGDRRHIDSGYASIPRRFPEVPFPTLTMTVAWTLEQFTGYLATWSAVQRYRSATGRDPLPALAQTLAPLWGDTPEARRTVSWPLRTITGRVA